MGATHIHIWNLNFKPWWLAINLPHEYKARWLVQSFGWTVVYVLYVTCGYVLPAAHNCLVAGYNWLLRGLRVVFT